MSVVAEVYYSPDRIPLPEEYLAHIKTTDVETGELDFEAGYECPEHRDLIYQLRGLGNVAMMAYLRGKMKGSLGSESIVGRILNSYASVMRGDILRLKEEIAELRSDNKLVEDQDVKEFLVTLDLLCNSAIEMQNGIVVG